MSLGVVASTMTALSEFAPADAGIAAGVFNSLRQVGSAFGVAIPAAAFDLAIPAGATDLMPGSHAAFVSRAVVFALALVAVVLLLRRPLAVPAGETPAAPRRPSPRSTCRLTPATIGRHVRSHAATT